MKRIKGRKKREDRASHSGVTEEKPVRSSLSFRRSKSRGSESTSGGAVETSSKSLPNFGDFKDLVEDDDERAESDDEPSTQGFPRRRHSSSLRRQKRQGDQSAASSAASSASHSTSPPERPISAGGAGDSIQASVKPLPRLLAPRTSIAATVAANRAAAQASQAQPDPLAAPPLLADISSAEDETMPLQASAEGKKKPHSTLGHMWKSVKRGVLNPKAAAADLHAISVSAAKQAGEVMTTVAGRVETDMVALHDQLLGGKRNLPDHPAGKGKGKRSPRHFPAPPAPVVMPINIVVSTSEATDELNVTGRTDSTMTMAVMQPESSDAVHKKSSPATPTGAGSKPRAVAIKAGTGSPASSPKAIAGEDAERSRGSAYMLSRYDEGEAPESPSKLSAALTKTAEALSQSTGAMLQGAGGGAIYLKKMLACGRGGRIH